MLALQSPKKVEDDPNAVEILRVWTTGEGHIFALRSEVWSDPAAWGILLVDLARHVALAHAQCHGSDPETALARIRDGFDAEWSAPTDTVE